MRNLVLSIRISYRDKVTRKTKEVGVSDSMSYAVLVAATLFMGIGLQIAWFFFSSFIKRKRIESRISEISIAIPALSPQWPGRKTQKTS